MAMDHSTKTGFSFGITSAIITTLGLMMGLYAGTHSRLAVIGGILTIAVADAFSDALGIHVSEEAENVHTEKEIWTSTASTFVFKLIFTLTFLVPVLTFELGTAVSISIIWGLSILGALSAMMAMARKEKVWKVVGEHLLIAVAVIIITNYLGMWISGAFG
jgi:VIT1/CCC1 family predicted Fe2+/Mn2+ transporter